VSLSDDLPPARRALFFPVVIATVLLVIIGMSAGIALASYHDGRKADDQAQSVAAPSSAPVIPKAPACRSETQSAAVGSGAKGTLRIVLLLRTKTSAVWICQDEAGQLFYHANRGGEHATWIEGQTALFIPGVRPDGAGGYTVDYDNTNFDVNADELRIVHKDGRVEVQKAIS
jgi:hypothetical protein